MACPTLNIRRNEDGEILSESEKVIQRWKEYFEEIINHPSNKMSTTQESPWV